MWRSTWKGYVNSESENIVGGYTNVYNADYIAVCAGRAEAGWRATIAAIDNLELMHEQPDMGEYAAWDALQNIIAAWSLELLQCNN